MRLNAGAVFVIIFLDFCGKAEAADAIDRLTAERLEAVHDAVSKIKTLRRAVPRTGPFREYRANLHVHSAFSHDSRGQLDDIIAAAKAVGSSVLMFTEHPAHHYDIFLDGHQGLRDGVLLIPGAESTGMLVYPRQSIKQFDAMKTQELSDLVRSRDGLTFLSHLEERMDWEISGLTGVEIYNTHADVKDEKRLLSSMKNPLWLMNTAELIRRYPQEAFSALQDYPADYLKRWDQLCLQVPHTGVSANDAHQNIGLTVRMLAGNQVSVEDGLGEELIKLNAAVFEKIKPIPENAKVGDKLFEVRLDPYECSLRHVGTHLLLTELSQTAVWDALNNGRAFVAFDWIADATGFDFFAEMKEARQEMGSLVKISDGLKLKGIAPLSGRWKLIRNGQSLHESVGYSCEFNVTQSGNYRAELWLPVDNEERIWILSNPIYVANKD